MKRIGYSAYIYPKALVTVNRYAYIPYIFSKVEMKKIFDEVYKVMKNKGYLTIITNNVFYNGRMYPLTFDTVWVLTQEPHAWVPKDEKIW